MKTIRSITVGAVAVGAIAALTSPLAANAEEAEGGTNVTATVRPAITLAADPTAAIEITPTSGGTAVGAATVQATVSTNNSTGYQLTLSTVDTATTMTTSSGAETIDAASGTRGAPAALAPNTWGYRVDGTAGFGTGGTVSTSTLFAGVPASGAAAQLKTTSAPATSDDTDIVFGVAVDATLPTGTYSKTVTITAITN